MSCRVWQLVAVLWTVVTVRAEAQALDSSADRPRFLVVAMAGRPPVEVMDAPVLRRRVTAAMDGVALGAALEEIGRQVHVRFAVSREIVPVDRRVSLNASGITLGGALFEVLSGLGLDVQFSWDGTSAAIVRHRTPGVVESGTIVGRVTAKAGGSPLAGATVVVEGTRLSTTTGNDGRYRIADVAPGTYTVRARYIGYAPGTASVTVSADQAAAADFSLEKSAQRLDEVVTTGTMVPTEVKALPTPISVVTADDIQLKNVQRVDQIFRGDVPGAIAFDHGPYDYYSTIYVRGASTLGTVPTIKTFIDGVEVVNPQYITTIDPNSIDRIEITRGPQASTLYGAGALNGVMQIFTKKGQFGLARPEVTAKLSAGGVGGFNGQSTALQTDDAVSVLGGGDKASYNLGGSYRHTGDWVSSYHSSDWGMSASGQAVQGPLRVSGSARYADKKYDSPWNTVFSSYVPFSQPPNETDRVRQQTYGLTAGVQATRSWQHTLTLGYDQTYLNYDQTRPRFTTPDDSLLYISASHEAQVSLLYHTDLSFRLGDAVAATATGGVNYRAYDNFSPSTYGATRATGALDGSTSVYRTSWTSTGYFAQVQVGLADRLFLTGGVRAERNENFGADFGTAWSPRVGAAYVLGVGPARVKLRASYGESIRAPEPFERAALVTPFSITLANNALRPERQRGADGGVEVYLGQASFAVTYYSQRAIDLIQDIVIVTLPGTPATDQFQNISRVKTDGWEFEGSLPLGPVHLAGTYSITNSTVQELPPGYPAGGYQVGDRIIQIPHTVAGATITYSPLAQTTLTASMTHVGRWINTDYLALFGYYYGGQAYRGSARAYWIEYPTVTKFSVGVRQALGKDLAAFVRAENVGNNLRYEQQNGLIPSPRSVLVGVNVRY